MLTAFEVASTVHGVFGVVGGVVCVYFGVRVVATVVDVYQRWRRNDWAV